MQLLPSAEATQLCKDVTQRHQGAAWALAYLGIAHARNHNPSAAVPALQGALRHADTNAAAWEALADSYRALGRYTGSLRVRQATHASFQHASMLLDVRDEHHATKLGSWHNITKAGIVHC